MVMKRKGDDGGGWGGGDKWGGGGGGEGKGRKGYRGGGGDSSRQGIWRGKPLKAGSYGEVAGRTFAVVEVGGDVVVSNGMA